MPSTELPAHLSYKSCLVLIPPQTIQAPIEALRRRHDRHFRRWMPHVTLLYPFLTNPSKSTSTIAERLKRAVDKSAINGPLQLQLASFGRFEHSRVSTTVWLRPSAANTLGVSKTASYEKFSAVPKRCLGPSQEAPVPSRLLLQLQKAVQEEFHECDKDGRPYEPHLSIGQAKGADGALELQREIRRTLGDFWESDEPSEKRNALGADGHDGDEIGIPWQLPWLADRIYVVERHEFHGRFKTVGEVLL